MKISEIDYQNVRNIYYICDTCNHIEPTTKYNVFEKEYKQKRNLHQITNPQYSINDNTLPRKNTKCPKCKKINDNVYYQNENLTITLLCNNCSNQWIYS